MILSVPPRHSSRFNSLLHIVETSAIESDVSEFRLGEFWTRLLIACGCDTDRLTEHVIIPAREGFLLPGTSTQGEQSNETCGQDTNPDGRFGLHVRGDRDTDAPGGAWADPVVSAKPSELRWFKVGRVSP